MKECIICILLFSLFMLGLYYEAKEKKRKDRECWLYNSDRALRTISDSFEQECFAATIDTFEKYTWNIRSCEWYCTLEKYSTEIFDRHKRTIATIQKDYTENLAEKFSNGYSYRRIDDLPDYLKEEYHQRIKDIASRYRDINFIMMRRIRTISPECIKENERS